MSDPPQEIIIPRLTWTHADVLAAVGLADLLTDPTGEAARIVETDGGFGVRAPQPVSDDYLSRLPLAVGYPFLQPNEKVAVPPAAEDRVDYKRESERVKAYRELRKQGRQDPKLAQDTAFAELLQQMAPRPDWQLLRALNVLQGDETSNAVHAAVAGGDAAERLHWVKQGVVALVLGRPAKVPWKAKSVQLFTPTAAKGYARLKPDSTGRGDATKEHWTEPFVEWLRYRGYFRAACPYFIGNKGEHVRLLCPVPADIRVTALAGVARALRRAQVYGGPAKIDCLAVLNLARILIEHSTEYHAADVPAFEGLDLCGRTPAEVISAVTVTHYQAMGSAKAVSAMSTLALPGWFPITDAARAQTWLAILDEHTRALRSLDDKHSYEISLLIQYRRFLERRGPAALDALLDFMGAYGQFLIRAREQKRRVPSFTTDHFKEVVMGLKADYVAILEDPGFDAVAAAVRRATVSAQAQKSMGQKDYREIRYDLIPELRRKRTLSDSAPFLEAVADFISAYNVENARRREMGRKAPPNVTTHEFASFCRHVQSHGASLVGALLCAYGSCRRPYEKEAEEGEEYQPEEQNHELADQEAVGAEEE